MSFPTSARRAHRPQRPISYCHRLTATLAARLYLDNCNACHFTDGHGAKSVFPRFDVNSLLTTTEPGGLIPMILNGDAMPSTASPACPSNTASLAATRASAMIVVKRFDANGEAIRGDRTINEVEAEVVRRSVSDYLAGHLARSQ
jgi:hypothetical protein